MSAPAREAAAKALEDYKQWLEKDLLPRSTGDFRLGADKFRKKLQFALSSDLPMEELMTRAKADLGRTQAAIYETALPLYKEYFPKADEKKLNDRKAVITAVLDKLAEKHPDDGTIVGYCQTVVKEATDFVKSKNLVTVPEKPLDVIVMPEFKRGTGNCLLRFSRAAGDKTGKRFSRWNRRPKTGPKSGRNRSFASTTTS